MSNTLTAEKKCALYDWIRRHKDRTEKFITLAAMASMDLGFTVTQSNMEHAWTNINGPRKTKNAEVTCEKLLDRINDLQARLYLANDRINQLTKRIEYQEGRLL